MIIDTKDLKERLFAVKQETLTFLDRTKSPKVRSALEQRVYVADTLLVWCSKYEKGDANMEKLTLGELVTWQKKPRSGTLEQKIVEEVKVLQKNGDAIKVSTVNWTTLNNTVYRLKKDNKINEHIVPRRDDKGVPHIVYLDEVRPKRSKK